MCSFCNSIDAWARAHCYRCDIPLPEISAEYQLCAECLLSIGLTEQPKEPSIYWRARENPGGGGGGESVVRRGPQTRGR
jgi:hypothetical protein